MITDLCRAFGDRFRIAREAAGLSQTEVGVRMMGALGFPWHAMTVARTEQGVRPVRLDEAVALAGLLGLDLTALVQPAADAISATRARWADAELQDRYTEAAERATAAEARALELERTVDTIRGALVEVSR